MGYDVVTLTPRGQPHWRPIGREGLRQLIVPADPPPGGSSKVQV